MKKRYLWLVVLLQLAGCTINPRVDMKTADLLGSRQRDGSKIGLALAGGGTKAAAYSMGVLAALTEGKGQAADQSMELLNINAISSVSGGGYSSLYLYSKLMLREGAEGPSRPAVHEYFDDCIPSAYAVYLPASMNRGPGSTVCSAVPIENAAFRFQQYVRCRQDIVEMDCRPDGAADNSTFYTTPVLLGATAVASVPNLVATSLFDWPVNMAPTRFAYKRGIGSTYALYPKSIEAAAASSDISTICNDTYFFNCRLGDSGVELGKKPGQQLGIAELRQFLNNSETTYPVWFINAAASRKRSLMGWAMAGQRDFSQYTLQISPFASRSGLYGKVDVEDREQFDLLQSVTAAAAFLDANETPLNQPGRLGTALGLHFATLDWGIDIDNPNVGQGSRVLHSMLFFPFYYLDGGLRLAAGNMEDQTRSAYIRLLDGGNNDDLGAFSLLEAGMKTIFISDHSGDAKGKMLDLCLLYNEIQLRPITEDKTAQYALVIPGLSNLGPHCAQYAEESRPSPWNLHYQPLRDMHYPIWSWTHPVLLGCVRQVRDGQFAKDCQPLAGSPVLARVLVLKPSLDMKNMRERYVDLEKLTVREDACKDDERGMCEVAAYMVDWYAHADKRDQPIYPFPQDSTVKMTFQSSAKQYGAYRELGRWQMRKAIELSKLPDSEFASTVDEQGRSAILPEHDK